MPELIPPNGYPHPTPRLSRREFLSKWTDAGFSDSRSSTILGHSSLNDNPPTSGLEPFVPTTSNPWDAVRAGHLLRRTTFMPRWTEIQTLVQLGDPGKAVDLLLNTPSTPSTPAIANDATESLDGLDTISRSLVIGQWNSDAASLRSWWSDVLRDSPLSIIEKMTMFWSSHFTSKFVDEESYVVAPLLYRQNKLFRENALGNFQGLVSAVTLDGAMLVFLGGNLNTKGAPNENYARELMELFTTGLGWYTEGDVQNAARILTGWRIAQYNDYPAPNGMWTTYFDPTSHDIGAKLFLNTAFPARDSSTNTEFLVRKEEIQKLVDTLFAERGPQIAQFIASKMYRFFVYSDTDTAESQSVIQAIADLLIQQNFEIKPVISTILKSAHFYDNANVGAQIKTPAEYVVGLARQLWPELPIDGAMTNMGQQLFEPPNVSGWPGYHDWVTTNTYPVRGSLAQAAIAAMDDTATQTFVEQFADYTEAATLASAIGALLLPRELSASRQTAFVSKLTAGAPDYEWPSIITNSPSTAWRNVRDLLTYIVALPDFELA